MLLPQISPDTTLLKSVGIVNQRQAQDPSRAIHAAARSSQRDSSDLAPHKRHYVASASWSRANQHVRIRDDLLAIATTTATM